MRLTIRIYTLFLVLSIVSACGGGSGSSGPPANPIIPAPPVPEVITKVAGDMQTAVPGRAVATAPEVLVTDASGKPVSDIVVTFTVTSGGGSVSNLVVRTDSAGHASCGTWTLGPTKGINSLNVAVGSVAPTTFTALAGNKSQGITVTVLSPAKLVGRSMDLVAAVTSTNQLSAVTVSINGGVAIPMSFSSSWRATLSLAGQPRGDLQLVLTATDVFGNSTDTIAVFTHDEPPTPTVSTPIEGALARPRVQLTANCVDDDPAGCKTFVAQIGTTIVASGASISKEIDLSAYEGQEVELTLTATDSINEPIVIRRHVFVESSAHLALVVEVTGDILDVSDTRILYLDSSGPVPTLKILNIGGSTTIVEASASFASATNVYGFLTADGAIYIRGTDNFAYPYAALYEFRTGMLTNLGGVNSENSLKVAGNHAIYSLAGPPIDLWSRNLATGVSTLEKSTVAGNTANDIAANGDIAYWTNGSAAGGYGYNIHRIRGGTDTALTNDSEATLWNTYPITDGINVVYQKRSPCCSPGATYRIAMHDGTSETILTSLSNSEPLPGSSYAAANGIVAYAADDATKAKQIWRHGPSGDRQLTFFGSSSTIDLLLPDGTVVLRNSANGKRYRAIPGEALQDVGSALGRVIYRDGRILVILGHSVLQLSS